MTLSKCLRFGLEHGLLGELGDATMLRLKPSKLVIDILIVLEIMGYIPMPSISITNGDAQVHAN